ncbi:MAG: AAA family ATPase [Acidimicrobiia bacterium]
MADLKKERRPHVSVWERIRILLFLGVVLLFFVAKDVNPPFVTWGDSFSDFASSAFGVFWLALIGLEVLRQIHYLVSEFSAGYHYFWQHKVFGGAERKVQSNTSEWFRYRMRRLVKIAVLIGVYVVVVMIMRDDISGPAEAIVRFPEIFLDTAPVVLRFLMFGMIIVFQFVMIFWFLSRGGIDVAYPQDIDTRFDDVKGQDNVLDLVKENIAFLEKPDEIEAKGGYIPGGILLWGPPGTGKTLMAEAIAGEIGKPYVFVDPGAFIQMFFGVGILKVKRLFRKLRKLSLQHGGVIVFFDEADSLGSRGSVSQQGQGPFQPFEVPPHLACNGMAYMSEGTQAMIAEMYRQASIDDGGDQHEQRWPRIVMGAGMGGGGMGTLQALLTEMSGLKKPRGLSNRLRRILGMRPKPPPKYRILIMMATNMPNSLDEALLRPGRIDRIYKVGYPSKEGRKATFDLYLSKIKHNLTEEDVYKLSTVTPYYSGAKIKDVVNEALILAIRDDRDTATWEDVWRAKSLKELGPPDDSEYVERERHAVAIHEAAHAVAAHLIMRHKSIDLATIERRGTTGGMVKPINLEDRFVLWKTEYETEIKTFLASLAGERMFFEDDSSAGVSADLRNATQIVALMEGVYGMGEGITSMMGLPQTAIWQTPDPTERVVGKMADRVEQRLRGMYDEVWELLDENRDKVLAVAAALEEHRTISGDMITEIMGSDPGSLDAHLPIGFHTVEHGEEELAEDSGDGKVDGKRSSDGKKDRKKDKDPEPAVLPAKSESEEVEED